MITPILLSRSAFSDATEGPLFTAFTQRYIVVSRMFMPLQITVISGMPHTQQAFLYLATIKMVSAPLLYCVIPARAELQGMLKHACACTTASLSLKKKRFVVFFSFFLVLRPPAIWGPENQNEKKRFSFWFPPRERKTIRKLYKKRCLYVFRRC